MPAIQLEDVRRILRGIEFKVVLDTCELRDAGRRELARPEDAPRRRVDREPLASLCASFARCVAQHPERSELAGERICTPFRASPDDSASIHLMHFAGGQDVHFHPGPRLLSIFSSSPWRIRCGGVADGLDIPAHVPFVTVEFPPQTVTLLRMKPRYIHGFEGENFAAISMHYTDLDELASLGCPASAAQSPHIMGMLSRIVPRERLRPILSRAIPAALVQAR